IQASGQAHGAGALRPKGWATAGAKEGRGRRKRHERSACGSIPAAQTHEPFLGMLSGHGFEESRRFGQRPT
ncbi:MAG: hypothetical protein ACK56I_06150, partial [bacterium]